MRNLTKQEASQINGAIAAGCFTENGFGWIATGPSCFEFDGYKYYASAVVDEYGLIVFYGNSGTFKNSCGKTCYVNPCENGNVYIYLYNE